MKKKILVLTDDMPWGHRSIAKAIFNFLKNKESLGKIKVEYAEAKKETDFSNEIYKFVYRYFPGSGKLVHDAQSSGVLKELTKRVYQQNLKVLRVPIERVKPDLVISAFNAYSHTIVDWKLEIGAKFDVWNVVADPWTIGEFSFVPGADLNLVYDEISERLAIKAGVEPKRILKTGWWTRKEMFEKYDSGKIRKKLGVINDGRPVIFVGGGSLGNSAIVKVLPTLMLIEKPVTFVFNCGTDKLLLGTVEEYKKMYEKVKKDGMVQIINLGWIENIAEVLVACDIVFGKGGPNFIFDCGALGKPIVVITHIGGQEDGNLDLVIKKKLGWVKERSSQIREFLLKYVEHPEKYNKKYAGSIDKEAKMNEKSLEKIYHKISYQ